MNFHLHTAFVQKASRYCHHVKSQLENEHMCYWIHWNVFLISIQIYQVHISYKIHSLFRSRGGHQLNHLLKLHNRQLLVLLQQQWRKYHL